jgi:hypothetical protein
VWIECWWCCSCLQPALSEPEQCTPWGLQVVNRYKTWSDSSQIAMKCRQSGTMKLLSPGILSSCVFLIWAGTDNIQCLTYYEVMDQHHIGKHWKLWQSNWELLTYHRDNDKRLTRKQMDTATFWAQIYDVNYFFISIKVKFQGHNNVQNTLWKDDVKTDIFIHLHNKYI